MFRQVASLAPSRGVSLKERKERNYRGEPCGSGHAAPWGSLPPMRGVRRELASWRGRERWSDRFLGPVVPAASRPSRFGVAETLVPVATISISRKLGVFCRFPPVSRSGPAVVYGLDNPDLSHMPLSGGCQDVPHRLLCPWHFPPDFVVASPWWHLVLAPCGRCARYCIGGC
jgi:hypothetical protein